MEEAWYEGLPEDALKTDEIKAYEKAIAEIRNALAHGLDFDSACASISINNPALRAQIIDDMLKIIIAEEHFAKNVSLEVLADALTVSVDRLKKAIKEMFEDIERQSIAAFHKSVPPQ